MMILIVLILIFLIDDYIRLKRNIKIDSFRITELYGDIEELKTYLKIRSTDDRGMEKIPKEKSTSQ